MKIEIPTKCPCCDSMLELVNDQLFCRDTSCSAQLGKKLEHFCKALSIKGFGAKTLEKLKLNDITELYYLELGDLENALSSKKLGKTLFNEIEKSKSADLATVLSAMSIPLVGSVASKKISSVVSSIDEINAETCKKAGLGDKVTTNLLDWLEYEFKEMREFLPFSFKSTQSASGGNRQKVCITGKLSSVKTKSEASKLLEAAGYEVVSSVTKQTDILLDESDDNSEKRKKAEQYGIKIINNLYNLVNKE